MKKMKTFLIGMLIVFGVSGCGTSPSTHNQVTATGSQTQQDAESQLEKFQRLVMADNERLKVGSDNRATIESIEDVFQPRTISEISEITNESLSEPGRPYYFKIRAIYKGHDQRNERVML